MKTMVVSSYPPSWAELAKITCATHKAWCERHGYDYYADCSDVKAPLRSAEWGKGIEGYIPIRGFIKLDLILHYMDKEHFDYDQVIWLDADLLITNPERDPFNECERWDLGVREGSVYLPYDANGHNATVMAFENIDDVYALLWAANNMGRTMFLRHDWAEMEALRYFLQTPPYSDLVMYESIKELCPMPPGVYPIPERIRKQYEWEEGDWSIHFSALSIEKRVELAKDYLSKCMSYWEQPTTLDTENSPTSLSPA